MFYWNGDVYKMLVLHNNAYPKQNIRRGNYMSPTGVPGQSYEVNDFRCDLFYNLSLAGTVIMKCVFKVLLI